MPIQHNLKTLMTGLYYPAFLGAYLVFFFIKIATESVKNIFSDLTVYYGIILFVYLSSAFISICILDDDKYSWYFFIIDLTGVVLIFFAFYFLEYVNPSDPGLVNSNFYYFAAGIALIDTVWSRLNQGEFKTQHVLNGVAIIGLILGGCIGWQYQLFNILAIIGLALIVIVYLTDKSLAVRSFIVQIFNRLITLIKGIPKKKIF